MQVQTFDTTKEFLDAYNDAAFEKLERAVVDAVIHVYYTDGNEDSDDGPAMRQRFAALKHSVDDLMTARAEARLQSGPQKISSQITLR